MWKGKVRWGTKKWVSELTLPHPFLSSLLRTLLSLSNWVREMRERYERETQPINDGGSEEGWAIISLPVSFPFIPLVIHSTARRSQGEGNDMRGKEWPFHLSLFPFPLLHSPLSWMTRWKKGQDGRERKRRVGRVRDDRPLGFLHPILPSLSSLYLDGSIRWREGRMWERRQRRAIHYLQRDGVSLQSRMND